MAAWWQGKDPDREPRPRRRATYSRPHRFRHLFAAYGLAKDKLYGHIKKIKNRSKFLDATCAPSTHRCPAWRSCATTTPRT